MLSAVMGESVSKVSFLPGVGMMLSALVIMFAAAKIGVFGVRVIRRMKKHQAQIEHALSAKHTAA